MAAKHHPPEDGKYVGVMVKNAPTSPQVKRRYYQYQGKRLFEVLEFLDGRMLARSKLNKN